MEEHIEAHRARGTGLLRGSSDARVGGELVCRPADLKSQVDAAASDSLGQYITAN